MSESTATMTFKKGYGIHDHAHEYDHDLVIISGEVAVQTGGCTHYLKPGDRITHKAGYRLRLWVTSKSAIIERGAVS